MLSGGSHCRTQSTAASASNRNFALPKVCSSVRPAHCGMTLRDTSEMANIKPKSKIPCCIAPTACPSARPCTRAGTARRHRRAWVRHEHAPDAPVIARNCEEKWGRTRGGGVVVVLSLFFVRRTIQPHRGGGIMFLPANGVKPTATTKVRDGKARLVGSGGALAGTPRSCRRRGSFFFFFFPQYPPRG